MERSILRWLNQIPLVETSTCNSVYEAKYSKIVVKVINYLYEEYIVSMDNDVESRALVRDVFKRLQELTLFCKTRDPTPMNLLSGELDTWIYLKSIHDKLKLMQSYASEGEKENVKIDSNRVALQNEQPHAQLITKKEQQENEEEFIPPPPPPLTLEKKSIEASNNSNDALQIHARMELEARTKTLEIIEEISNIIPIESSEEKNLRNGLLLCKLVCHVDSLINPQRRNTLKGGGKYFVGVELNPKSRAARLNNIEIALKVIRETWKKGMNTTHIWSATKIADGDFPTTIHLFQDIATFYHTKYEGGSKSKRFAKNEPVVSIGFPPKQAMAKEEETLEEIEIINTTTKTKSSKTLYKLTPLQLLIVNRLNVGEEEASRQEIFVSSLEKQLTQSWLRGSYQIEVLSTYFRSINLLDACNAEFNGYEGGPMSHDPLKNGYLLCRCALELLRGYGGENNFNETDDGETKETIKHLHALLSVDKSKLFSMDFLLHRNQVGLRALETLARVRGFTKIRFLTERNVALVMKSKQFGFVWLILYALSVIFGGGDDETANEQQFVQLEREVCKKLFEYHFVDGIVDRLFHDDRLYEKCFNGALLLEMCERLEVEESKLKRISFKKAKTRSTSIENVVKCLDFLQLHGGLLLLKQGKSESNNEIAIRICDGDYSCLLTTVLSKICWKKMSVSNKKPAVATPPPVVPMKLKKTNNNKMTKERANWLVVENNENSPNNGGCCLEVVNRKIMYESSNNNKPSTNRNLLYPPSSTVVSSSSSWLCILNGEEEPVENVSSTFGEGDASRMLISLENKKYI